METTTFKTMINSLHELNTQQQRILRTELNAMAARKHVSHSLETPYQQVKCPHCQCTDLYRWGKRSDMQRYRCKSCKKTFNSLTGTPLAHLRRKGHWLDYARCMKEGLTVRKAAEVCGIHPNTAFKWRHRFLLNTTEIKPPKLAGIIEANECYFRKSEKGSRKLKRPARKRGKGSKKKTYHTENICVFVSRDRNKNTLDEIFDNLSEKNLTQTISSRFAQDSLFCSNSYAVYHKYAQRNQFRHARLNLSKGETVKKDIVHLKNVDTYHHNIREWIIKKFHGVATKYLINYLAWIRQLDEFENNISPHTLLLRAKSGGEYKIQPLIST